jgi:ArsR family transcriptional regulator
MAFSKARFFPEPLFNQSFWFKAQGHPARIIILSHLLQHGTTPFYILRKEIPLSRTTVCQHLKTLRENGLITVEEKHPHTYYTLNHKTCKGLAEKIKALQLSFIEGIKD